ncbi:MAG TPA: alpha/beta hydrolase, partial [Acetobacteraceae bacterium]|nr:alpha/beta hydrolase [Acetobacteraceae bacterium]
MADPENPAEPKATRTARPARTRAEAPPDPDPAPSPAIPSPIALPNDAVERALRTGDQLGPLEDLFGPAALDELRRLARDAEAASVRGGDRVLILPGIMGSKLGRVRPILDDVIWLNPAHIVLGRFDELRLGNGAGGIEALGVFLFAYLALKLRLRIRGHAAEFHAFDWRLSVDDLAEGLRRNIAGDTRRTHLVCHSMGGLVARAMFRLPAPANIGRIITLGTPHNGSYAPVQAFRGVEATVRKIAALDLLDANPKQKQEHLAAIFGTFPGLLQMIPSPALRQPSLFNPLSWPQQGARPGDSMLARAAQVQDSLPKLNAIQLPPDPKAPDRRIVLIVGSGTETVIAARRPAKSTDNDEFTYDLSDEGDGTVPLDLATVPDLPTYVTQAGHGGMPNDPDIARAVDNILVTGATKLLPELDSLPPVQRRGALLRS